MTFDIEIVLRDRDDAIVERVSHEGNEAAAWTDADVQSVLRAMLGALDRARHPRRAGSPDAEEGFVALRGFSWIVEPTRDGVVIAIEITTGAAVAGPFDIPQPKLDGMVTRVLAAAAPSRPVVH